MGNLNKTLVIGNLAAKPTLFNQDPNKKAMLTGRIAANDYYKDAAGVKQKRTTWFDFVIFGKRAERFFEYMDKGSTVYLEGDMREETFNSRLKAYPCYTAEGQPVLDQNGQHFQAFIQVERKQLKLYVSDWKFMDSKPQTQTAYGQPVGPAATPQNVANTFAPAAAPAAPAAPAAVAPAPVFAVNNMPSGV